MTAPAPAGPVIPRLENKMKWPRSKYNGKRITGFAVEFEFDTDTFQLTPFRYWCYGDRVIGWLGFSLRFKVVYE